MSTRKREAIIPKSRATAKRTTRQLRRHESDAAVESGQGFVVTPLFGAMLRVTHEELTQAIIRGLRAQGIEMTETEFSVMRYPGPDGVRPTVLAQRCNMTKQAMNYVLAGLVAKGYIERKSLPGRRARIIFLTSRGWGVLAAQRKCAINTEREWAAHIGERRFNVLHDSLYKLAIWLGKLEAPATVASENPTSPSGKGKPAKGGARPG